MKLLMTIMKFQLDSLLGHSNILMFLLLCRSSQHGYQRHGSKGKLPTAACALQVSSSPFIHSSTHMFLTSFLLKTSVSKVSLFYFMDVILMTVTLIIVVRKIRGLLFQLIITIWSLHYTTMALLYVVLHSSVCLPCTCLTCICNSSGGWGLLAK